jgi:hypothetical protein
MQRKDSKVIDAFKIKAAIGMIDMDLKNDGTLMLQTY